MADCKNETSRLQKITGHRRRTISQSDIHDCLLEQWSGLAIDANSFDQARDAIHQYMVSGHWTPAGSILMWSGDPVALDDAESAAVFTSLCNQSTSTGLCCDSIELCHGFVETIHLLSKDDAPVVTEPDAFCVHSSETESAESTINSDSDDSTLTDLSTTHSACTESQSDWFARVSLRHDGSPPEEHTPAIANRPIRNCTRPVLYTPSPSGIARDVISSGEFYAAIQDSDLSDVSITSGDSTSSTPGSDELDATDRSSDSADVEQLRSHSCHGHVVGGRHSPHLLPSVPVTNDLNDMTRGLHALSIDNTTSLRTADSAEALSTDGQGETLLSVVDEDLSARYSRFRTEARILMQAHIILDIHTLTQYNLSMHSVVANDEMAYLKMEFYYEISFSFMANRPWTAAI